MAMFGIYVKFLGGTFQSSRVESDNNVQEGETPPCFRNFRIVQVACETSGLSLPYVATMKHQLQISCESCFVA